VVSAIEFLFLVQRGAFWLFLEKCILFYKGGNVNGRSMEENP
jgi:hypothetical protein